MNSYRLHLKWLVGFFLSIVAIWIFTAIFTENHYSRVWSETLQRNVPASGRTFSGRKEGWATTRFGELGIAGTPDVHAIEDPKVLIWGDSYVAAAEVSDQSKMHRALTGMMQADQRLPPTAAVGIGKRFRSVADYVFLIPLYESEIKDCRLHVVHVHSLEDFYPDRNPAHRNSLFLSEPNFHFERYDNEFRELEAPVNNSKVKDLFLRGRLHFFAKMKKRVLQISRLEGMRFSISKQTKSQIKKVEGIVRPADFMTPDWASLDAPIDAWKFALGDLKESTKLPILIVYGSATPSILKGEIITTNPERDLVETFSKICSELGIGFTSLEEPFLRFWENTGKFPKGFHNSRPWEGHYNPDGHRLAAEAIHIWISENRHVVYPD